MDTMDADAPTSRLDPRDVVAIVNTSPDTVDLLQHWLERAGMVVVVTYTHHIRDGQIDLAAFLRAHEPRVIVYDIAPPYERNWQFLQHLRKTVLQGYQFVLTTTNPSRVEPLVGRDERVYEVVDRDGDLDAIVQATREALRSRATR